jgi:hypothetical protein
VPDALFLHLGLPKTGTTYLQAVLAENRPRLREQGFLYPFVRREAMFHAAVEVCRDYARWGLDPAVVDGTWDNMTSRVRDFDGTGIISHEILSGAAPDQVAWAAERLHGLELHLVVTARDPSRQVPAHWQEEVKNGRTSSFADITREVLRRPGAADTGFWATQDLVGVLERWAGLVPPDRVHVVVCPAVGAERDELWRRFSDPLGLPEGVVDLDTGRGANESLGAAEVHLLREVNRELAGSIRQPYYSLVVKRLFAQRLLRRVPSERALSPEDLRAPLTTMAEEWVAHVQGHGYAVHGDLAELRPARFGSVHPDELAREVPGPTLATVTDLLREVAAVRRERAERPEPRQPQGEAAAAWWRRRRRERTREAEDTDPLADREAALVAELTHQIEVWSASQTGAEAAE